MSSSCGKNIKVYISDYFVEFPYNRIPSPVVQQQQQQQILTIFVPTYADEKVILKNPLINLGYQKVNVLKYVSNFNETDDEQIRNGVVVYWNAITQIRTTGVGDTLVFNVVLSDNLYACSDIIIDTKMRTVQCPLQVDYSPKMTLLKGECAGDSEELRKAKSNDHTEFCVYFDKETPMGIKILNTKRFLLILSMFRETRAKVHIYLSHNELATIHKELSWESTRRRLRGGTPSQCTIIDIPSYKYVMDALELIGVHSNDKSSLHKLIDIYNPLILKYNLVPAVLVELNNINGVEKHVRLYCKYEGFAITNAGPVPLNMPTQNPKPFVHKSTIVTPPSESFYKEIGTRRAYLHSPIYNYFL